jgi:hypothetical protein
MAKIKTCCTFTKQRLLEWSIVSIGSNTDALKRNADVLQELKQEVQPAVLDIVDKKE